MVDVAEGLHMEGVAVLVGQLHADAVILAFFDLESVPCFEEWALHALLGVEENIRALCHEDGPSNEIFFIVEERADLASSQLILLIDVIDKVKIAVIAGEDSGRARWLAGRWRHILGSAENDTVGEVFISDNFGLILAGCSFIPRNVAEPLGNVCLLVVPRIDSAIAELSLDFRSALEGLHVRVGKVAIVLGQKGVANVLLALAPDVLEKTEAVVAAGLVEIWVVVECALVVGIVAGAVVDILSRCIDCENRGDCENLIVHL